MSRYAYGLLMLVVLGAAVVGVSRNTRTVYTASERDLGTTVDLAAFQRQQFGVLTTELSPAVVIKCGMNKISFFRNMSAWGLGAPTFAALPADKGVEVIKRGGVFSGRMREAWMLCWFNGADGWREWDAPVMLVLQRHPTAVSLSGDGLTIEFDKQAGLIAVMPLYGYRKVPLNPSSDYLEQHGMPGFGLATNGWQNGLPAQVVDRCRYFTRVLRAVPVYCREEFSVDADDLLVRSDFDWLMIPDDWRTRPIKLAPLPPVLALAWWSGKHIAQHQFPMTFSEQVKDVDLFTPYGPFAGVESADGYTVRMNVLKYVDFVRKPQPIGSDASPEVAEANQKLQKTLADKFRRSDWNQIWDHGGPDNYCWQVMGDRWYAKAIPYLPDDVAGRVKSSLAAYLDSYILQERNYKPFEGSLLLAGPGVGTWGGYDDAGKFASNTLETIWNIAYYSDAWDVVKERWPMIKRLFITPHESDWKSVGRYSIAELGDEAAPALAMARLAYKVGDQDTYGFASYMFARELVHHYVKQVGAPYFRQRQPFQSDEFMPDEVYLTNLWGSLAGWQIDGPDYPGKTGERQYNNRWVRFSSDEVARFYQDVLPSEIRLEMDRLTERAETKETPYKLTSDTAHIAPSMIRLRALLLNDPPQKLAQLAPPEKWKVHRPADVTAICLTFMRSGREIQWERLIQPAQTGYALGLERLQKADDPGLTLLAKLSTEPTVPEALRRYPILQYGRWRAPKETKGVPSAKWWGFGQVIPDGLPYINPERGRLNWNTQVWLFGPR